MKQLLVNHQMRQEKKKNNTKSRLKKKRTQKNWKESDQTFELGKIRLQLVFLKKEEVTQLLNHVLVSWLLSRSSPQIATEEYGRN